MNVEYTVRDRIGYITLNRPEKRNALSFEVVQHLKDAFTEAAADDAVKVVVLKASGDAFCAGADLEYLQGLQKNSYGENLADSNHLKELFLQIYTLNKVVVAQIQGHALAGGCGLASVCDFSVSVPEAKFGYTEVKIGFIPALVMVFLIRKIGEGRSKQLLLSGELIKAEEALTIGLINKVVSREQLEEEVYQLAQSLIQNNSGYAMMVTKKMIGEVQSMSLQEALTFAAESNAKARESADCRKGIASFLNKEKITW
jgi:methylglutaconyl-CoA hydratase